MLFGMCYIAFTCVFERVDVHCRRPEDQAKIRMAVGLRRIDPRDVPESAKLKAGTATSIPSFSGATQKKRKATDEPVAGPSQSGGAARTRVIHIDEDIEEIVPVEEVKDELYVTLRTNVVGVQYYQGMLFLSSFSWIA